MLQNHNTRLDAAIAAAREATEAATSKADLLRAVTYIRDFKGELRFDNTITFWQGVFLGVPAIAFLALWYTATPADLARLAGSSGWLIQAVLLTAGVCLAILALGKFLIIHLNGDLLPSLSSDIAQQAGMLTAAMSKLDESPARTLSRLRLCFQDYARGNHSREILEAFQGYYQGAKHAFAYCYYHLEYVEARQVRERVSDGKGGSRYETRTKYDYRDRYSLVVEFPWVRGIAVRYDDQEKIDFETSHTPTASDFNDAFVLTGVSTLACARFAKPVTVLQLLAMEARLDELNLEFSLQDGGLCVSFDNDDLLDVKMPCNLTTPGPFHAFIESGVHLENLEWLLEAVHTLALQHDDNFELPPAADSPMEHPA